MLEVYHPRLELYKAYCELCCLMLYTQLALMVGLFPVPLGVNLYFLAVSGMQHCPGYKVTGIKRFARISI